MHIQWYPGHMAKAKREVTEQLKKVDIIIELADARIPFSSRNPMLDSITQHKPRLIILTKSDKADPVLTSKWTELWKNEHTEVLSMNALEQRGVKELTNSAQRLAAPMFEKMRKKGIRPRAIRAMIIGIPNVGKSTLINRLVGRKTAKTGDRPGVTKAQQWLKVGSDLELLDTPGILWPKFDDQRVGYHLAATGAIKDELLDFQDIALFIIKELRSKYPDALQRRYNLTEELPEEDTELFEMIGRKRGCLLQGGFVDYDKAAELIINDLRKDKLGAITLEHPEDLPES
ncbi:Ras superfamily GTP-binding protein YlqF [Sinobaca qinghaiensis]|uniref:Ribosome biogenesis GTPase A n=1 Tax=Sinobaca qinghaiensis TaxID=342944 RepID=A0A419V5Z1_9BACL|nr:ribosome biogenesis GTPase YlqF [Sinobaca qinghaiensis]RKD75390.1 Ras superfamily GTP-binding protein YlqF [Sinobaca qinghaiensis]